MNGPSLLQLETVWQVTLVLLVISSSTFFVLLVIRALADKRDTLLAQRQKAMETALIIHLSTPLKHLSATLVGEKRDFPILMEAALRLLRVQRGESQGQLLKALMETGIHPWLLQQLKSGAPARRIKAIELLIYWPTDEVTQAFLGALRDGNIAVELAALEGLAEIADTRFQPDIVAFVLAHPELKENLIYDVFVRCGASLSPALAQLVRNDQIQLPVRLAAMLVLAENASAEFIEEKLLPLCSDNNPQVRATACLACNKAGLILPFELLQKITADDDWRVRQQAAALLVRIEPVPVEKILRLLGDENWLVALSVANTLQSLGETGRRLLGMLARTQSVAGQRARQFVQEGLT